MVLDNRKRFWCILSQNKYIMWTNFSAALLLLKCLRISEALKCFEIFYVLQDAPIIICSPNTGWLTHFVMPNKSDSTKFGGSGEVPQKLKLFAHLHIISEKIHGQKLGVSGHRGHQWIDTTAGRSAWGCFYIYTVSQKKRPPVNSL